MPDTVSRFGQPVPELPVRDVVRSQQHYHDALGLESGWLKVGDQIGTVSRHRLAIAS